MARALYDNTKGEKYTSRKTNAIQATQVKSNQNLWVGKIEKRSRWGTNGSFAPSKYNIHSVFIPLIYTFTYKYENKKCTLAASVGAKFLVVRSAPVLCWSSFRFGSFSNSSAVVLVPVPLHPL